jgi:hypothetical protein
VNTNLNDPKSEVARWRFVVGPLIKSPDGEIEDARTKVLATP